MHQRVLTGGFVYDNGKVLILKRGAHETFLANHWELPGGKLEFGEDPWCGVLREVKEEAGLDCEVLHVHSVWHDVTKYKGADTHFVSIGFILKMKPDQMVKVEDGIAGFAWVTEDELNKYLMTDLQKKEIRSGFIAVKKLTSQTQT